MRSLIIRIVHPLLYVFSKYYFLKPRKYNYKQIRGTVNPNVFHPQFTISTKVLLDYVDRIDIDNKVFLELGCGTGLISTYAALKGAKVIATDINDLALKNVKLNANNNSVKIQIIKSDLFQKIPQQIFDYIIINPPYYPKMPKNDIEKAWYCGIDFEYFKTLFSSISPYFNGNSMVIMILSEDCEIKIIKKIASTNKIAFETILETKKWGEKNYLFELKSI